MSLVVVITSSSGEVGSTAKPEGESAELLGIPSQNAGALLVPHIRLPYSASKYFRPGASVDERTMQREAHEIQTMIEGKSLDELSNIQEVRPSWMSRNEAGQNNPFYVIRAEGKPFISVPLFQPSMIVETRVV